MTTTDVDDAAPRRKRPIAREWHLQVAIRQFCRDALADPPNFLFMSMNSALNATRNQYARAVAAGEIQGRPDTVLFVPGKALWAELKHGTNKASSVQEEVMNRLRLIGHQAIVINSVCSYYNYLKMNGVPLRPHAGIIAADLDLKVAARIARAEQRATTPGKTRKAPPRFGVGVRLRKKMNANQWG